MCGIAGIFDGKRAARDRPRAARAHERVAVSPRPGRGRAARRAGRRARHRRLSIIDLSTGQQPLYNEDGSVVRRLQRRDLQLPGAGARARRLRAHVSAPTATPRSSSTPGRQWGEACVKRFRGMFAFALWDRNRETLFLARDRLGVKPLYYALLADGVLGVRLRAEGAARASAAAARDRSAGGRGVFRLRLRARAAHDLQGRAQARARAAR